MLAFIYFLFLSLVIAIWAAFDSRATLISFAAATVAIGYLAFAMRSTIILNESELEIDRAHIEIKYLGEARVLTAPEMRAIRTRDADPAAHLAIKFWVTKGLKIEINDPRDPTPYWLISCKRGEELAALLNKFN